MTHRRRRWLYVSSLLAFAGAQSGCYSTAGLWNEGYAGGDSCDTKYNPAVLPLGSVVRAHFHQMQTNAEAADFIFYRHDFAGYTAELSPAGKDKLLEIAARARSAPFPILIERSENNSDPELDAHRRQLIARIMFDLGIPEADQRVVVSPAYSRGMIGVESQIDYWRFIFARWGGFGGGFGGGGFGGGGFGGGGFGGGGFF